MVYFKQAREFIFLAKQTEFKHCHVGLLEITPSISEKPACSRTEEMINKITKNVGKDWKKIKNRTIDETCRETARFRMGNRLHDVQERPTST